MKSPPREWLDSARGSDIYLTYNDLANLLLHRNHYVLSLRMERKKKMSFVEHVAEKFMLSMSPIFALRPSDYEPQVFCALFRFMFVKFCIGNIGIVVALLGMKLALSFNNMINFRCTMRILLIRR